MSSSSAPRTSSSRRSSTPTPKKCCNTLKPLRCVRGCCTSAMLRDQGRHDDLDLSEKHLETKTGDFCVIRESKPSGGYIMNFYRPKYVSCTKTESGEHTRCPRGRGRAQEGRARPPPSWSPRVLPRLLLIFLFF